MVCSGLCASRSASPCEGLATADLSYPCISAYPTSSTPAAKHFGLGLGSLALNLSRPPQRRSSLRASNAERNGIPAGSSECAIYEVGPTREICVHTGKQRFSSGRRGLEYCLEHELRWQGAERHLCRPAQGRLAKLSSTRWHASDPRCAGCYTLVCSAPEHLPPWSALSSDNNRAALPNTA